MNIAVVLAATYWIETILAREIRLRRAIAQDGGAPTSTLPVARLLPGQPQRLQLLLGLRGPRGDVLLGIVLRRLSIGRAEHVILASDVVGAQALTFAIPLGTLFLVLLWGFFQRRPTR